MGFLTREPINVSPHCVFRPFGTHCWKWNDYLIVEMGVKDYALMRSTTEKEMFPLETVSEHRTAMAAAEAAYNIEELGRDVS